MNWIRIKPWLVMGLIFIVGIITGVSLTVGFRSDGMHPPDAHQMRNRLLERLTDRLQLTADQQAKIEPILIDAGNQMQALHRDEVERVSKIIEDANTRIAPLLTADQLAEFKKMEVERPYSSHMHSWSNPHEHPRPPEGGYPGGPPAPVD